MAGCRVLLPNIGYSSSRPLEPGQHYHLKALDVGFCVDPDAHANKFGSSFLIRTIKVSFPSYCTFVTSIRLIQLFPNLLYWCHIDIQTFWNVCIEASRANAKQYSMSCPNFWSRCSFPHKQCPTDPTVLGSWQTQKQTTRMREIKNLKWRQFTHPTLYIYVNTETNHLIFW